MNDRPMTAEDVLSVVAGIRQLAGDPEAAHSIEDALREDVLKAIAGGAPNAAELAAAVLTTSDIDFPRWCA